MNTPARIDILNFNFFDWSGERVFTGGAERYVYDLAQLCRRLGLHPRLIQNATMPFERQFNGIDVIGVPAAKSMDFEVMSLAFAPLTRDATLIVASPLELACRLDLSPPVIGINHGIHWDNPNNRRSTFTLARFRHIFEALDVVSKCVCVDTNFGNWLQSVDGRALPNLEYIPNYVDSKLFRAKEKRFDRSALNVLFPRRLCEERGFRDVLEAFDSLLPRHPEIALHLCGGGIQSDEQLAHDFLTRHPTQVRWSELAMEQMPEAYSESHVVLVPSVFSEGASLSCIEAMACNNAVIATTVGGLPNLIIDGYNGLLIHPGVRSLAAAVERLLADRVLLASLARNAVGVSAALSRTRWEERWVAALSACVPLATKLTLAASPRPLPKPRRRIATGPTRSVRSLGSEADPDATERARHWMHEALRKYDMAALERSQLVADRDGMAAEKTAALATQAAVAIERDQAVSELAGARLELDRVTAALGAALLERDSALAKHAAAILERDGAAAARDAEIASKIAAVAARDAAVTERDAAATERDTAATERDAAVAQRATAVAQRDGAVLERDAAVAERDAAIAERDATLAQREAALSERDSAQAASRQTARERDRAIGQRDAANADRDAVRREMDAARIELATATESLRATLEAKSWIEQQHYWTSSELRGIKTSTGWRLLQILYKIRFALFPRGSYREAVAKKAMQLQRRVRKASFWRRRAQRTTFAAERAKELDQGRVTALTPAQVPVAVRQLPAATPYGVVCLPLIDWHFRFQRPQQLARCFARNQHAVYFARLAFGASLTATQVEPGVEEIELPGPSDLNPYQALLDPVQAEQMAGELLAHLAKRRCDRFVCVTQLPFWTPLAQLLQQRTGCDIVYDCMDHHAGFTTNSTAMLAEEDRLLRCADLVITSSSVLYDQVSLRARNVALVRNAADYEHFAASPTHEHHAPDALVVGYYGAIADWFDSDLMGEIARLRPNWRFVLVGSTFSASTEPLTACTNIDLPGEKPYAELPLIIAPWDCCLIPFKHCPLTQATNPVKVYEMLAAGKPIVAVGLPELEPIAGLGLLTIAEDPGAFVAAIERAVASDTPAQRERRRSYAAQNDWQSRQQQIDEAISTIHPLVSVIIVTYNNLTLNRQCLDSVLGDTDYPAIEVIVIDNASADGTQAFLQELASRDNRVRIVLNAENRGFSAANNQGALLARGRYLCFLNNDTVVHGAWLSTLIDHLRRHPTLGLIGPATNAIANAAKIPVAYRNLVDMPAWADQHCAAHRGELREISMLAFFCVLVPRHIWDRVGTLDERFGAGMFEDDDYNRRVRAAGFDIRLALDSFVHHWQKASFDLLSNEEYLRIYRENETLYHAKWGKQPDVQLPPDGLTPLRRHAQASKGTVIFAPSVGWAIDLAQRPHHLARALASEGYTAIFDCSNDNVDFMLEEVERGVFLYNGEPQKLTSLPNTLLWTFTYNYDFRDHFPADTPVVYDWIDDLSVFPYDQADLRATHKRALRESALVTCVARRLYDEAKKSRDDAIYLPNAVEEGRFDREPQPNRARSDPALKAVLDAGGPIAGYYGALAEWFDYDLLLRTADLRPDWTFVLIGPDHDGSLQRAALERCRNICWLGPRDYLLLPGYLHLFDVATIPFKINNITTATSPLKLYEYFAAGKPVISTAMPECSAFPEVHIVGSAEAFAAALDSARASTRVPESRRRLVEIATQNTWRNRVRTALRALHASGHLGSGPFAASQGANIKRFHDLATPSNQHFFRALAAHLVDLANDPTLPAIFGYAIAANARGREEARHIASLTTLAGKRTLDIDCTYGGLLVALAELGAEPEGMEPQPALLKLARCNFRDTGHDFPIYALDVAAEDDLKTFSRRYDVVTCNAFFERARDPKAALQRIRTMLRGDGVLICHLPNRDAMSRVLAAGPGRLFGLTPLGTGADFATAANSGPAADSDPPCYPSIAEYGTMFAAAGFDMAMAPSANSDAPLTVDQSLAELRQSMSGDFRELGASMRTRARALAKQYLAEVDAMPRATVREQTAFRNRYQSGSIMVVARLRPGTDESARTAVCSAQRPTPAALEAAATLPVASDEVSPAAKTLMERFGHLQTAANRHFFRALCAHSAGSVDDPCLPMYFEFALSTNERGRVAADIIERLVPLAGKRALDVGCAYGGFLIALSERGADAVGIDIDRQLLQLAWHNFRDIGRAFPTHYKDVTRYEDIAPFVDSFDIITCNDVIEHVSDPRVAIRHVADMLRPGGLAYFEIPNRDAWPAVVSDGHYQLFGITQLERDDAQAYFSAHAPGVAYGVGHYLTLGAYQALFEEAGLDPIVLNKADDAGSLTDSEAGLADLSTSLAQRLNAVPQAVRDRTRAALERYLAEATAAPRASEQERQAFLLRYATGFWRIAAHKPSSARREKDAAKTEGTTPQRAVGPAVTTVADAAPATIMSPLLKRRFVEGRCNVCGKATRFFYTAPELYREELSCEHCRTTSRYRSIARGLLAAIAERSGVEASSLAQLPTTGVKERLRMYDTQPPFSFEPCAYPLPDLLDRCDWIDLSLSTFKPDIRLGAPLTDRITNQNLEALTFSDSSFDIVVTSDVMEHVRLDGRAHAEIARVLRPGGHYLFTVPHFRNRHDTFVRVRVADPNDRTRDEYLTEPEYHGDANADGVTGVLSYRSYGTVLDDDLSALGFDVHYTKADFVDAGILNTELFHCRKR